jgi:hypothetical protein
MELFSCVVVRFPSGAVLAERLRRTLKARVRKSVGSIPTDCIIFLSLVRTEFFLNVSGLDSHKTKL